MEKQLLIPITEIIEHENADCCDFVGPGDVMRISSILGQQTYNNIIYSGKSGVGKTANIYGLVQAQTSDPEESGLKLPLHMINQKFVMLNTSVAFDGSEEQIRANFLEIRKMLTAPGNHVLVIEDTNDFLDAIKNHNVPGLVPGLMSNLRMKLFQCILMVREEAGTDTRLAEILDCHSDIDEMFTLLTKESPDQKTVEQIILARRLALEAHHDGLHVTEDACKEVVDLTHSYASLAIYQRQQPARSIRLLSSIASSYLTKINQEADNSEQYQIAVHKLQKLNTSMNKIEAAQTKAEKALKRDMKELTDKLKEQSDEPPTPMLINTHKTTEIKDNERVITACKKDLENQILPAIRKINEELNVSLTLDTSETKGIFSAISGIPSTDLDDNESEKILHLKDKMLEDIYGQDSAVTAVTAAIKRSSAGLKEDDKPIGAFIMLGSSGVGKSYLAEILAKCLFGDESNLTVFDMSEFMEKHTVSKLIGAPPGYAGYGSGGALPNAVREKPHQVILLDEIEKGHEDVYKILFQVMDKGRLSDELGTADFSNVILLMTTNIADHLSLQEGIDTTSPEVREEIIKELLKMFPQALLNRVDDFLLLLALHHEHLYKIVKRRVTKINTRIKKSPITVSFNDEQIKALVDHRYKKEEGSRQILKFIGNKLESKLADFVLGNPEGGSIDVKYNAEKQDFDLDLQPHNAV